MANPTRRRSLGLGLIEAFGSLPRMVFQDYTLLANAEWQLTDWQLALLQACEHPENISHATPTRISTVETMRRELRKGIHSPVFTGKHTPAFVAESFGIGIPAHLALEAPVSGVDGDAVLRDRFAKAMAKPEPAPGLDPGTSPPRLTRAEKRAAKQEAKAS